VGYITGGMMTTGRPMTAHHESTSTTAMSHCLWDGKGCYVRSAGTWGWGGEWGCPTTLWVDNDNNGECAKPPYDLPHGK